MFHKESVLTENNRYSGKTIEITYSEFSPEGIVSSLMRELYYYDSENRLVLREKYYLIGEENPLSPLYELDYFQSDSDMIVRRESYYTQEWLDEYGYYKSTINYDTSGQPVIEERLYTEEFSAKNGYSNSVSYYSLTEGGTPVIIRTDIFYSPAWQRMKGISRMSHFYQIVSLSNTRLYSTEKSFTPDYSDGIVQSLEKYDIVSNVIESHYFYNDDWIAQKGFTNMIRYYNPDKQYVKKQMFFNEDSAKRDGVREVSIYQVKNRLYCQEELYTLSASIKDGITRALYYYNDEEELERVVQYYDERWDSEFGYESVTYRYDLGSLVSQEIAFRTEKATMNGYNREVILFDRDSRVKSIHYYYNEVLLGKD